MGETTHISWADHTFNPWIGCMKVSPACDGCYAENLMATRYGRVSWGAPGQGAGTRDRTSAANWKKPLAWNSKAAKDGTSPFVFCASLADVFDNAVPAEWRRDLFGLIRATPHLTWLLLTKRPQMIVNLFRDATKDGRDARELLADHWPRNAAIGCTVVTQAEADRDVPHLLAAKAALNPAFAFLSMEPLLGPVDLTPHLYEPCPMAEEVMMDPSTGQYECCRRCDFTGISDDPREDGIDWVITGGETDQGVHKARPTATDWFRTIRDQCAAAGVAYHHKQNGEWATLDDEPEPNPVFRIGKARAGRLLDGLAHDARPAVRA